MAAWMLAFAFGVILLQGCGTLPGTVGMAVIGLLAALACCRRRLWPLAALGLGLLWAALHAHLALEHRLPKELEGVELDLVGEVVGLPERQSRFTQFELRPERLGDLPADRVPRLLKLSWYGEAPALRSGETWQLRVRLKRPHGVRNPGGFDYERWLFARGIDGTGYVREPSTARLLGQRATLDRLRQIIADEIGAQLPDHPARGVVLALVVGDTRFITQEQWEWMRVTGTSHLVAISGLHVAMVAGLLYLAVGFLWRRFPRLCLWLPAPIVATAAAAIAATAYAGLAGFSLPTQRALIMLAVPAVGLLARRRLRPWRAWTLALVAVLLWDPFAPLSAGFWLSFSAVAVLFAVGACHTRDARWLRYLRPQFAVSLALLPLTALLFQQGAWLSPVANVLAIPAVTFVLVPLALVGSAVLFVWPPLGAVMLGVAGELARWGLRGLELLARADQGASSLVALPWWALGCGFIAALFALSPRGMAPRLLMLPLMLPFVLYRPAVADETDGALVTILDVGQGLAVVIEVGERVLVYDTGPAFGDMDAGASVVVPFLRARGIDAIDLLVVSHGDLDHSGGVGAVVRSLPVRELVSGDPLPATERERPCHAGDRWNWGGVELSMLWPSSTGVLSGNNGSCVLAVRMGRQRILLTGDVEAVVERTLVASKPESLRADVLIVPHHGSRSSSTEGFVDAVRPRYAVVAAGYRNRYGFPRPQVLARYEAAGAKVLSTYATGALSFEMSSDGLSEPSSYRSRESFYYHDRTEM